MDAAALMSLWKTDELPACDEGMVLALEFLTSCVAAAESGDPLCRVNTSPLHYKTISNDGQRTNDPGSVHLV